MTKVKVPLCQGKFTKLLPLCHFFLGRHNKKPIWGRATLPNFTICHCLRNKNTLQIWWQTKHKMLWLTMRRQLLKMKRYFAISVCNGNKKSLAKLQGFGLNVLLDFVLCRVLGFGLVLVVFFGKGFEFLVALFDANFPLNEEGEGCTQQNDCAKHTQFLPISNNNGT